MNMKLCLCNITQNTACSTIYRAFFFRHSDDGASTSETGFVLLCSHFQIRCSLPIQLIVFCVGQFFYTYLRTSDNPSPTTPRAQQVTKVAPPVTMKQAHNIYLVTIFFCT